MVFIVFFCNLSVVVCLIFNLFFDVRDLFEPKVAVVTGEHRVRTVAFAFQYHCIGLPTEEHLQKTCPCI